MSQDNAVQQCPRCWQWIAPLSLHQCPAWVEPLHPPSQQLVPIQWTTATDPKVLALLERIAVALESIALEVRG